MPRSPAHGYLLSISLLLSACSPLSGSLPNTSGADFQTQALTANYLTRKLKRWRDNSLGPQAVSELDFGRQKHAATLTGILAADLDLCADLLALPAVTSYASQHSAFEDYIDGLPCSPNAGGAFGLGDEFRVNTYTSSVQGNQRIAMNDSGSFVITWSSLLQDGDPPLASAISGSREAIWGILCDPQKFAKL